MNKGIVEILQDRVDKITTSYWKDDDCPPKFYISVLYDELKGRHSNQYLILNIEHQFSRFSRIVFPLEENIYGYDDLYEIMKELYNQTM